MTDPHAAVLPALTFLREYYAQLDRMLSDVTRSLRDASPPWQRLRRLGTSYETEAEVKVGQPERFVPEHIGSWCAPSAAFSGGVYGAKPAKVRRLAFVGAWLGSDTEPPELYIGWLESMPLTPGQVVEKSLKACNVLLDPWDTQPEQLLTPLAEVVLQACPFKNDPSVKMAMARVALAEIDGPEALGGLVTAWVAALNAV
ncbi:MAG: hypothetical protein ACI8S6_001511 [Myxococcota bacterium]|jgi:hypothetical protein